MTVWCAQHGFVNHRHQRQIRAAIAQHVVTLPGAPVAVGNEQHHGNHGAAPRLVGKANLQDDAEKFVEQRMAEIDNLGYLIVHQQLIEQGYLVGDELFRGTARAGQSVRLFLDPIERLLGTARGSAELAQELARVVPLMAGVPPV